MQSRAQYYVCTNLSCGTQIACDRVVISPNGEGFIVESNHRLFNTPMPPQDIRFAVDREWSPERIDLRAGSAVSAEFVFGDTTCEMRMKTPQGDTGHRWTVGRRSAYVMLSGVLYLPLHIVRRFSFETNAPLRFTIIPNGFCEVRRVEDAQEGDRTFRVLRARFFDGRDSDVVDLFVTPDGELEKYYAGRNTLMVKRER
jgi:hypothetical protein